MSLTNVGICGASGKMGKALIRAVVNNNKFNLTGALEHEANANVGKDSGVIANIEPTNVNITSDTDKFFAECDAIIDFSFTDASVENIKAAMSHNCSYIASSIGEDEKVKNISLLSTGKDTYLISCNKAEEDKEAGVILNNFFWHIFALKEDVLTRLHFTYVFPDINDKFLF